MIKVLFFQPYTANWREEFLKRFKEDKNGVFKIEILSGYHNPNKNSKTSRYLSKLPDKTLYSLNKEFKYKNQNYPIYFSPSLLLELIKRKPEVIVTEGEINILNNIQIFLYSILFRKKYLWWSLGKVRNRKTNFISNISQFPMKLLLKKAEFILARNTLAKNYYKKKNYRDEKIILVPNSMDDRKVNFSLKNEIAYPMNKNNILFIGTLIKQKRLELLINSVNELKKDIPDIKLKIIGSGPEQERLKILVDKLDLKENITFTGAKYDDVSRDFYESNIVVLPGMGGLSIQHAMLHERPVICSIADGIENDLVINKVTGYIIPPNNKKELTDKIKELLLDKVKSKELGENALRNIEKNWNMDIMVSQMSKAIEKSYKYND